MKKNIFLTLMLSALIYSFFYSPQVVLCQEGFDDFTILEKPDHFFYDKGIKALIFQIDENFNLKNFQSTIISFKYHFSPKFSIRIGAGGFFEKSDSTHILQNTQISNEYEVLQTQAKAILQFIACQNIVDNISAYLALGPIFIYDYQRVSSNIRGLGEGYENPKIKSYSIGGVINYGIEWMIKKKVALLFEGGIIGSYNYKNTTMRSTTELLQTLQDKTNSYTVKGDKVKFGVALYF